jgi:hypothetical protein
MSGAMAGGGPRPRPRLGHLSLKRHGIPVARTTTAKAAPGLASPGRLLPPPGWSMRLSGGTRY